MRAMVRRQSRVGTGTASALALVAFGFLATSVRADDAKPAAPAPSVTTAAPAPSTTTASPAPAQAAPTQAAPSQHATAKATPAQPAASTQAKPAPSAAVPAKVPAATAKKPATAPSQASAPPATTPVVPTVPLPKMKVVPPGPTKTTGITKQPPVAAQPAAPATGKTNTAAPGSPTAGKPAPAGIQLTAQLDEQVTYQYNALGRRDPFQPLIGGEYVGADVGGDAPPDVGGIKVVGIVWGDADKFALVEDGRGESHVLRRGDKVMNGYVESLNREGIVVSLTTDGQTQSVTIPLTRKGDKANASNR
jgi:hypothetical protein